MTGAEYRHQAAEKLDVATKQIHLITAVWGQEYVKLFLDSALASQMAQNNLPEAVKKANLLYKIYTTKKDVKQIVEHPAFHRLDHIVETQIIAVSNIKKDDKFALLKHFHNQAIKDADHVNAALIFLSPDFIMANGSIGRIMELHEKGYKAVFVLTLRLMKESFLPELHQHFYSDVSNLISVQPRNLVKLALNHLHPIEKSYYWGENFSSFPIHAYWPVGNEGIIARCYYLHPIFVDSAVRGILPRITIDADYVDRVCTDPSEIFIVKDSDDLCVVELSQGKMKDANAMKLEPFRAIPWNYARWASVHANPYGLNFLHHRLFQIPIRFHSNGISHSWKEHEIASEKIAKRIWMWTLLLKGKLRVRRMVRFYQETRSLNYRDSRFLKVAKKMCKKMVNSKIDLTSDIPEPLSFGWGEVDESPNGRRWRWIGAEGKSRLILKLKFNKDYILKTQIHTAVGNSLYNLKVEINGKPALNQHVVSEKGKIWHYCILPDRTNTERDADVEIVYNIEGFNDGHTIALSQVVYKALRNVRKKQNWFFGLIGVYDLTRDIRGSGWGEVEQSPSGRRWRWIGAEGKAILILKLKFNKDYILKTQIHTAMGNSLYNLKVEVNGQAALNQHVVIEKGKIWHYCILPADLSIKTERVLEITYQTVSDSKKITIIALSTIICRPLKYDPKIIYRALKHKIAINSR